MNSLQRADALNQINIKFLTGTKVFLDESWNSRMYSSPFSKLYFIKEGDGYLKTPDGTVYPLEREKVYLIPANLTFAHGCTYLEKIFFHISVTAEDNYDLFSSIQSICALPFPDAEYRALDKHLQSESYEDLLQIKAILTKTMADFFMQFSPQKTALKKHGTLVKRVLHYIQDNPRISLSVKEISDALFISESTIRNTFLKEMGLTIGKYIDDMVFIKAKEMLFEEQFSIAEISTTLGFCDQFYFSRRFREKFGETPSRFRKNALDKKSDG